MLAAYQSFGVTDGTTLLLVGAGVALLVAVGLVLWGYNRLVRLRNLAQEGWAGIDVQLRRRHDLIPNLVEAVKGYAAHENQTLAQVIAQRGAAASAESPQERQQQENALSGRIRALFAVAEAYPDLKASTNFRHLSAQLIEIEDHLQKARRYYNGATRQLNTAIESIPTNLIAGLFGFKPRDYFEIQSAAVRASPEVTL